MAGSTLADMASKVLHDAFALFAIVATVVLLGVTMDTSKDDNSLFLTNTFLSTYYSDAPAVTFSPAGDPYTPDQITETYYKCLFDAQVGVNTDTACKGDDYAVHRACLISKTTSDAYKQKRLASAVVEILGAYQGEAWNLTVLPSQLTNSNVTKLGEDLGSMMVVEIMAALHKLDSPLSRDISESIVRAMSGVGIPGCLHQLGNNPSGLRDISPIYDQLWACTAAVVHTEASNHHAFEKCIPQTAWPALDVMQTPYSSTFLGSYNKHFVLVVGMWLMCSFAVYSAWLGVESAPTANGKPAKFLSRAGQFLVVFCVVWNAAAVVIVVARGFGDPASANYFPMTIQTVMVTLLFSVLGLIYFGREAWETFYRPGSYSGVAAEPSAAVTAEIGTVQPQKSMYSARGGRQVSNLGAFMRVPGTPVSADLETVQYTPLLVPTWSDCWVICDGLLLLGVIGTSTDVVTADIVMCFVYALAAAVAHSSFVRLLDQGYVNDVPSSDGYAALHGANNFRMTNWDSMVSSSEFKKEELARQGLRVMAMVSDIATLMFSMIYWYLVFSRYGSNATILSYVILTSVIPSLVWLTLNLLLDFEIIFNQLIYPAQFLFAYNIAIRSIFVFVIISTLKTDARATFTDDNSLRLMIQYISA